MDPLLRESLLANMDKESALLIAKNLVRHEKITMKITNAKPAIISYMGKKMIGNFQHISKEDNEIVLCAHTSFFITQMLVDALIEVCDERIQLTVDDGILLSPRQDILRMVNGTLTKMTPEQIRIAEKIASTANFYEL